MTLMQIKYFLAAADTGSITRAAEQLFISQPGLSKQLPQDCGVDVVAIWKKNNDLASTFMNRYERRSKDERTD